MLSLAANAVVLLVALEHAYILVLEMFFWTAPAGRRAFGSSEEFAAATRVLAANQGLYNGFLAAGLLWGLLGGSGQAHSVKLFFMACVLVAGVFGAATTKNRRILFVQAAPAALGCLLLLASR